MNIGKKLVAVSGIISLVLGAAPMIASSKDRPTWQLPADAVKVDDNVYYLGAKPDPRTGKMVEGLVYIHRAKPASAQAGGKKGGPAACYAYLAKGAKWKSSPESWMMNPNNVRGLDENQVFGLIADGISKWEDATDGNTTGGGVDIMGAGSMTNNELMADSSAPDDANEVYFADITGSANTIAVTTIWGIFSGPLSGRELVEWDQVYDDATFDWSLTGEDEKMDFDNIATHEIGHAVGMGHPSNTCSLETMYAYAANGETMKRDLHAGDIDGISQLY